MINAEQVPQRLINELADLSSQAAVFLGDDVLGHIERGNGDLVPTPLLFWLHNLLQVAGQICERAGNHDLAHHCRSNMAKVTAVMAKRTTLQ
ncbi:hypothetical protein [Dokdonella soli]